MEDYIKNEKKLKKSIEILESTFSNSGLKVENVGVQFAEMIGGTGIKFFCEVLAIADIPLDEQFSIKINVYDKSGDLISMGSETFNSSKFTGYDTFAIAVFHDTIHTTAAKAKIYLTK